MVVCPRCGAKYPADVERCRDCNTLLRSEAKPAAVKPLKLKRLATFAKVAEAEMIGELLKQNGIESMITGEADPIGATSGAVPIELLVDENDFDRASEIFSAEP